MQRSAGSFARADWSALSTSRSTTAGRPRQRHALDERRLNGARILVVEDDFLILLELETVLSEAGAQIAGACRTVTEALALAREQEFDAALLDLRVGREAITPVARCLVERGVPFAFYTGQAETDPIRAQWPDCAIIAKPAIPRLIVAALAGLVSNHKQA
jgi:DNA-binding response OmpR family regulator